MTIITEQKTSTSFSKISDNFKVRSLIKRKCEKWKLLKTTVIRSNIEWNQHKVTNVINRKNWVSPITATKQDKRIRETSPDLRRTSEESAWSESENSRTWARKGRRENWRNKWLDKKKNEVGFREYNALIEVIHYRIMNVKHRENHKRKEEIDQLE